MRLDHLLSKERITSFVWSNPTKTENNNFFVWSNPAKTEEEVENQMCFTVELSRITEYHISGGDAPGGNTRSHPEHDG